MTSAVFASLHIHLPMSPQKLRMGTPNFKRVPTSLTKGPLDSCFRGPTCSRGPS